MGIAWGYIRVSTEDQGAGLAAQKNAVLAAGVDERHLRIDEGVSGAKFDRPALNTLLAEMRKGDTLVVTKLDRLGRSIYGVLELFQKLSKAEVEVRVIQDQIDTSTPTGRAMRNMLLTFAEWEREMISFRTKEALAHIKRTGIGKNGLPVKIGRRPKLSAEEVEGARSMVADGMHVAKVARQLGVSRQTVYNCLETAPKV
jgi:DNA invertase Pin-like site-specific DNA recombinase